MCNFRRVFLQETGCFFTRCFKDDIRCQRRDYLCVGTGTFEAEDLKPALKRFRRYLGGIGLRASTTESYVFRAGKYLEFARTEEPTVEDAANFRTVLVNRDPSVGAINNYCFAIKSYHEMRGGSFGFPFIKPKGIIPYFFDEQDIPWVFGICDNIQRLTMLQTLFYACL